MAVNYEKPFTIKINFKQMTVCVWGGVVGGQCLLYIINMHFILLKLRNKKPFFNDCSAHFKIFFFTCNNVMFLSQPIRNLWIHNPIGYTMNLKSIINPRNIKNKMNILAALFLVILVCFQKSPPFCLPLNHHHQSSIINLLSRLFTIAHEYKMF